MTETGTVQYLIISFVVLLLLALVAGPVARLIRFPYASVLVLFGFAGSELLVMSGIDTGLRADTFQQLVFYVFIPLLVFESVFSIDKHLLLKNLVPVLFLAVVGMCLTAVLAAVFLFYGIGHEAGFPWTAALLTGAILAATDPGIVVSRLRELGISERLVVLLEGESLFNDATAIVLFGLFMSIALSGDGTVSAGDVLYRFAWVFLGGCLCGLAIGFVGGLLLRICNYGVTYDRNVAGGVLTLAMAYTSYLIADMLLQVSGVMSTLVAALVMSNMMARGSDAKHIEQTGYLWAVIGHLSAAILFIAMGVTITTGMFEQRWLAMLIAIIAVLAARAISAYGGLWLLSKVQKSSLDARSRAVIVWGGLRGAVTLALALSLPVSLDYWWTIQSIAFGVVLFTLFVQAPTLRPLLRRLGLLAE